MENQHRKISGYRELTQAEIDMINDAKELEARCLAFRRRVDLYLRQRAANDAVETARQDDACAHRWLAVARTDIETGFMALVRSIARPQPKE